MKLVEKEYDQLQKAISELGSKVSLVLNKQETEFLTAYKAHMRTVTRDFQSLKHEMDETTAAIENNVLVTQLENDRDLYKKEALHLDGVLTKTKQREKMLSEKVDELEQDRTWLSNQLKDIMKQKNALERRLEDLMINDDQDEHLTLNRDELEVQPPV